MVGEVWPVDFGQWVLVSFLTNAVDVAHQSGQFAGMVTEMITEMVFK